MNRPPAHTSVTADDLFPVFCYCLIQSGVQNLASHAHQMSDWIGEKELLGERGYTLVTLRGAIDFLATLDVAAAMAASAPVIPGAAVGSSGRTANGSSGATGSGGGESKTPPLKSIAEQTRHKVPGGAVPPLLLDQQLSNNSDANWRARVEDGVRILLAAAGPSATAIGAGSSSGSSGSSSGSGGAPSAIAGWSHYYTKNDVVVYRRQFPGNNVQMVKGLGLIKTKPKNILNLLVDPRARQSMDELYEGGQYTHTYDPYTRVLHMRFRARRLCQSNLRDFCLLMHWRTLEDGTFVIMGRSIDHPSCPPAKGYVRAQMYPSGWILRPTKRSVSVPVSSPPSGSATGSKSADGGGSAVSGNAIASAVAASMIGSSDGSAGSGPTLHAASTEYTDAIYIVHVEYKGAVPIWLSNLVSSKQPLMINAVRAAIAKMKLTAPGSLL